MNLLFHSVRWRLQVWHALILMGVITALCMLAFRLAADDKRERIDREIEEFEHAFMRSFWEMPSRKRTEDRPMTTAEIRERFLSLKDPAEFPLELRGLFDANATKSTYIVFWDREGQTLFRSANVPASLRCPTSPPPDINQRAMTRGDFRELVYFGPRGFRSVVGRDVSADQASLYRLGWQITGSGALLWLLGLVGGWWLAGRVIQPINQISQTASRIAGGKLSERINVEGTDNELNRLSQVLNDTFDRLAAAIERQREFTADASHELRTPLTVILSETSRGLKRERGADEYREILATCGHAATRMRSLVESLLLLARQDGNPEPEREIVDLATIAADTIRLLQPLADQNSIRIESDLHPSFCPADPNALAIVADNLISNAIHHQPAGGQVSVTVVTRQDRVILKVSNTGPGIPPEHLDRLFDRFYRIDPARGSVGGHSGLGLAIVKAITENHQGAVEVESPPGQGATFRVSFPAAANNLGPPNLRA